MSAGALMYEREKEDLQIAQRRVLELEKRCSESEGRASSFAQEARTLQDRVEEMQRQGEVRTSYRRFGDILDSILSSD